MIRMSSLPIAKFCGLAPKLYGQFGSGRAAAISSAFHAKCAGDSSLLARLTKEELDEVEDWKEPTGVDLGNGVVLTYDAAVKELEVCLSPMGTSCGRDQALTVGHLDFAWIVSDEGNRSIAYVADIKKSRWASAGPDTLQLHAYALAYALANDCYGYCTGIYIPTEQLWQWSNQLIEIGSDEQAEIWGQIVAAATNQSETGSWGPHCSNCYARLHCPEYLFPAALAPTLLGPLAEGGALPSAEKLGELVRVLQAGEKVFEVARERLKEAVRRGEAKVVDGEQMWVPVNTKGKESWDSEKLGAALGGDASTYRKRGPDYPQYRWVNRNGARK